MKPGRATRAALDRVWEHFEKDVKTGTVKCEKGGSLTERKRRLAWRHWDGTQGLTGARQATYHCPDTHSSLFFLLLF